jgi:hypothetical protein
MSIYHDVEREGREYADTTRDYYADRPDAAECAPGEPLSRSAYLRWCKRVGIENPRFAPPINVDDTPPF